MVKNLSAKEGDARDTGLISGSGRALGNRKRHPTPVFLPGESHRQRSLAGYCSRVCKDLEMTEQLRTQKHIII